MNITKLYYYNMIQRLEFNAMYQANISGRFQQCDLSQVLMHLVRALEIITDSNAGHFILCKKEAKMQKNCATSQLTNNPM